MDDNLTKETVNDIATLLNDYVVDKLDNSSELKKISESIELLDDNMKDRIKKLSNICGNIDDYCSDIKNSIEDANNETKKYNVYISKINDRFSSIETKIDNYEEKRKASKILIFGTINFISLLLFIIIIFKLFLR